MSATPYCCEVARDEGAALPGTATRAEHWLLVEEPGPWSAHAVEDNALPAATQGWLAAQLAALGKARALLIRRPAPGAVVDPDRLEEGGAAPSEQAAADRRRPRRGATRCYLAVATTSRRELYRFDVDDPAELAGLELAAGLAAGRLAAHRCDERLTLVCTNGRRDRCCARFGAPVFRALAALPGGGSVWQSTHQGGHRHAASVLWLPEGVAWGYVAAGDAAALVAARARGALFLPRFRGRTFDDPPVQAADAALRAALDLDALDAWDEVGVAELAADRWCVRLAAAGRRHAAVVEREREEALVSCSPAKRKAVAAYRVVTREEESR